LEEETSENPQPLFTNKSVDIESSVHDWNKLRQERSISKDWEVK